MKLRNSLLFCSLSSFALFAAFGCGGSDDKKDGDHKSEVASATDSIKYIKIEDSKDFLPSWSKDNVLVYHTIGEPDDMHPTNGTSASRTEINLYTQLTLVQTDFRTLQVRPIAVKALPTISANGLEYTYELRNDMKWDDGSPITVDDVIFTFKACKSPLTNNPHAKPYLDNLKDIVVDKADPNKFTLIMKRTYIQNIAFLTDYPLMQRSFFDPKNVLSKYTFQQFDDKTFKADQQPDLSAWANDFNSPRYSRDPKFIVGAGPYKLTKWDAGQSITLERKPNYWYKGNDDPYFAANTEKIILKINKDMNSQILEFKSQALDASTYLSTKTLLELKKDNNFNTNYNARFTDTYNYAYIAMNMKPDGIKHKKLFVDKRVRRAMALLTPVDNINKVVNKGMNKRIVGPVSPLKKEYNEKLKLIPFDIEQAKKLLDEAGWKDTDGDNIRDMMIDGEKVQFVFNLSYMTTTVDWKDVSQMISEQMYKAGIKANLTPLDFAVLYDNAKNHDFDMMLASWGGNAPPEDYAQLWHTESWSSKGSNYPGFGNAESDAILDSCRYIIDDARRIPYVKKFQEIVYEEQPYIFLYASLRRNVVHKRFGNVEMYYERPGLMLNALKLLAPGSSMKNSAVQ